MVDEQKAARYHLQIRVEPALRPAMLSMTDDELESFVLICRECGIIGSYPPGVAVLLYSLAGLADIHEAVNHRGR